MKRDGETPVVAAAEGDEESVTKSSRLRITELLRGPFDIRFARAHRGVRARAFLHAVFHARNPVAARAGIAPQLFIATDRSRFHPRAYKSVDRRRNDPARIDRHDRLRCLFACHTGSGVDCERTIQFAAGAMETDAAQTADSKCGQG